MTHKPLPVKKQKLSDFAQKATLISITLASIIAVSSVIPLFPLLAKHFNVELHDIGIVLVLIALPGVFLSPVAGVLADRWGRKKLLLVALVWHSLASLACAFTNDLLSFLFVAFLMGVGAAPLLMLYATIIGDLYQGVERIKMLSLNSTAMGIGVAFFPFLSGLLGDINWRLPFFLPLLALPAAFAASRLEFPPLKNNDTISHYLDNTLHILRNKKILAVFVVSLLTFVSGYSAIYTGISFIAHLKFEASSSEIGTVLAFGALSTACGAFLLGRFAPLFSPRFFMMTSYFCHIVALSSIYFFTGLWWLIIPVAIYGFGQGFITPNIYSQIMLNTPEESRAVVMAINAMIIRAAQVLGPLLSGFLLKHFGLASIFEVSILMMCVLLILVYLFIQKKA
ncbi:MFS transporter [Desulfovibrio litoralis]|uniref:Predicted arabinose efflux permease, MFS family n=1 Tax=Desulfovibrio litoralis DSM 11393 TaxID=1121455 RepID=A0A1M7SRM0_9BACT|nr:MFS transporter [Desulfovibrio litoralis]SHN61030.1 Predicted arabinose efflux permease, MFS family [Desulfovibrio litoralis DSM 11393]